MTPNVQAAGPEEACFGFRDVESPNGAWDQVPLTLQDVLHPRLGDKIAHSPLHNRDRDHLFQVFRFKLRGPAHAFAASNLLIDLGLEGVPPVCPDAGCFVGLDHPPDLAASVFRLKPSGGRCLALVEIASPWTRLLDTGIKLDLYHRAEVPLYAVIDHETTEAPRVLRAFRWTPDRYEEMVLEDGWLPMPFLGLSLGMIAGQVACRDLVSGRVIPDHAMASARLDALRRSEAEAREAALRRELDALREQLARLQPPA
ncbi:MAG: Uma2 family endonuclease [Gemmataceae bacterium]|nr:Uma2 family endonuclease [Gemmataceae bacterium]